MSIVCFINPPMEDFYYTAVRRQPLGLLYISAAVKAAGYAVEFINGHSPKSHVLDSPPQLSYLKQYVNHPDPQIRFPFTNYYHFGLSYEELYRQLKATKSEVFFVSAMFTTYYEEIEKIIGFIQELKPKAKIIVGGYHASLYPEYFLNELKVDFVINGEGELSAVALLDYIYNGGASATALATVPNLIYLQDNIMQKTAKKYIEEIDTLPFPARELLKPRDFKFYKKNGVSMIVSRGCPNNCEFCSSKDLWGLRYRRRSVLSMIEEIHEVVTKYNVTLINFEDDNLFITKEYAKEILEALIDYQKQNRIKLDFTAMNGVSIEAIDAEIVELMAKANFSELNISLVSYSAEVQKKLGRPFDSEQVSAIVAVAKRHKMNVRCYFILGLPEQTKEEIEATLDFMSALGVKIFPSVFYNVYAPPEQWKMQRSSGFFNETEHLKRSDLLKYFNRTTHY